MPKVDIGIACAPNQSHNWWVPVMTQLIAESKSGVDIGRIHGVGSALPDYNKNGVVDSHSNTAPPQEGKRDNLTDANRSRITGGFLEGDADYLFMIDDDTVPPSGALSHLLGLGREFVGGVYYLAKPPHNPIAYFRNDNGTYSAILDYAHGALIEVDSIGMGCTLIHRSVFEKIQEAHEVFMRPNGSLFPILKEKVYYGDYEPLNEVCVINGTLNMPLFERDPEDTSPWPFYALEYGRTEDHHFCELAAAVGIRPYLDTAVICDHWKMRAINRTAHQMSVKGIKQQVTHQT